MPDVDHPVPDLEGRVHPRRLRAVRQLHRVVQQHLVAAHVDQQRRQVAQVREERGGQRVPRGSGAEVGPRHVVDAGAAHDGISLGVGAVAGPAHREIGPRGDADAAGGPRHPGIAQRHQGRHREPAARGVAADHDAIGRDALLEEPAIGGGGVLHRGRERMLGGQPVVEQQRGGLARGRDGGGEMAVRARGADHVAASVQVEHDAAGRRPGRPQPLGGRDRRAHALHLDLGRGGEGPLRPLVLEAVLGHGHRVGRGKLRQVRAHRFDATVGHGGPPGW